MKLAVVGPGPAWFCIVVSIAAIFILGFIAFLYNARHESLVGGVDDPPPEAIPGIVSNIVMAILVYVGFLVFCCGQVFANKRASRRRGEIAL